MLKSLHRALGLLAVCVALLGFSGCGGSDSLIHIDGSPASISRATLNHWMEALGGLDFRSNIGTEGPTGLASEPADYKKCAAAVKLIAPKTFFNQVRLSEATISGRCHQLYRSIKAQAMSYLIGGEWTLAEGAEQGLKVSDAEVKQQFALSRRALYPTEAQLKQYLRERHWVLSDLLYEVRRNILVRRLQPKLEAKVAAAGGGTKAYARIALERVHDLTEKTSCKAGYVAPDCKEYHGPESVLPAPNVILEGIVQGSKI
jgi:foldase protein PrsA